MIRHSHRSADISSAAFGASRSETWYQSGAATQGRAASFKRSRRPRLREAVEEPTASGDARQKAPEHTAGQPPATLRTRAHRPPVQQHFRKVVIKSENEAIKGRAGEAVPAISPLPAAQRSFPPSHCPPPSRTLCPAEPVGQKHSWSWPLAAFQPPPAASLGDPYGGGHCFRGVCVLSNISVTITCFISLSITHYTNLLLVQSLAQVEVRRTDRPHSHC